MLNVTELPEYIRDLLSELPKVYVGDIPSLTDEGIGISLEEGTDNLRYFGMPTLYRPLIRITIRSEGYTDGMSRSKDILRILDGFTDQHILQCIVIASPYYLGKTEQKLHEIQITFNVTLKE